MKKVLLLALLVTGCVRTIPTDAEPKPIAWNDTWALRAQPTQAQLQTLGGSIEDVRDELDSLDDARSRAELLRRQLHELEEQLRWLESWGVP